MVLAGGLGRRLGVLTKITNKHLLPVWDRPMIFYPLQALVRAGIDEIILVVGGHAAGDFIRLLGNGNALGIRRLVYAYQEGQGGIADALSCAREFCQDANLCVVLGDNIFSANLRPYIDRFLQNSTRAHLLLKKVDHPERFGVPEMGNGRIQRILEKPKRPPSNYAVTGIYCYAADVFDIIAEQIPSRRGELEISDVSNDYIRRGDLTHSILSGWWTDAGTVPTLLHAARLAERTWKRTQTREALTISDRQWSAQSHRSLFTD